MLFKALIITFLMETHGNLTGCKIITPHGSLSFSSSLLALYFWLAAFFAPFITYRGSIR
jgi:hypothetical protein